MSTSESTPKQELSAKPEKSGPDPRLALGLLSIALLALSVGSTWLYINKHFGRFKPGDNDQLLSNNGWLSITNQPEYHSLAITVQPDTSIGNIPEICASLVGDNPQAVEDCQDTFEPLANTSPWRRETATVNLDVNDGKVSLGGFGSREVAISTLNDTLAASIPQDRYTEAELMKDVKVGAERAGIVIATLAILGLTLRFAIKSSKNKSEKPVSGTIKQKNRKATGTNKESTHIPPINPERALATKLTHGHLTVATQSTIPRGTSLNNIIKALSSVTGNEPRINTANLSKKSNPGDKDQTISPREAYIQDKYGLPSDSLEQKPSIWRN